ncbi:MAG: class I tRNA ligase family protein, partial [Rhodobacterales bacterium]|nr:class I tRNA ligase family protein [Rhodobacterales bacterium]
WFDAPIEYIAATAEWAAKNNKPKEEWERWWRTDKGAENVKYVQFMGKDNVPFHTLSFPATIMGADDNWKLVDFIKSFNYLNYDGGQFSTSKGRGVFMNQALDILPSDYWRWWLLSNVPESSDSEFTWDSFQQGVNKDLADVLGNFVSRITKFCRSKFGEIIPDGNEYGPREFTVINQLEERIASYENNMAKMEVRKSATDLRAIWSIGNEYLQDAAPWTLFKEDPQSSATIVRFALNLIPLYAALSEPFIPDAADTMVTAMNVDKLWPENISNSLTLLKAGHKFSVPEVMFAKITDEAREEMNEKFSGKK